MEDTKKRKASRSSVSPTQLGSSPPRKIVCPCVSRRGQTTTQKLNFPFIFKMKNTIKRNGYKLYKGLSAASQLLNNPKPTVPGSFCRFRARSLLVTYCCLSLSVNSSSPAEGGCNLWGSRSSCDCLQTSFR